MIDYYITSNELYIHVAHLFCFLCCSIVCPYVLSSVLWCSLRFPHKNYVRFVFTSICLYDRWYLIYVICVYLRKVMLNTYCVVFLFSFSSSCVTCFANFSGLSIFNINIHSFVTATIRPLFVRNPQKMSLALISSVGLSIVNFH